MKKILQKDSKVLREKCRAVKVSEIKTKKIQKIIDEMSESLSAEVDGVAIAAPQIGYPLRIFVISPLAYKAAKIKEKKNRENHLIFINPKITKQSKDKKLMEEGCLSVRPIYGKVRRSSRVTIEAYDENGEKFETQGAGLIAQIFQHETDHLEGVLFTDKAKDLFVINVDDLA